MEITISRGANTTGPLTDLLDQLLALDGVRQAEMAKSPALPGNLMLEVLKTGAATSAAEVVIKWLAQDRNRVLKMKIGANEIEASGLSHAEQMQLIDWFQTQTGVQLTR